MPLPKVSLYSSHVEKWSKCTKCSLHSTRTRVVLARGKVPCDILFIGEAPGASEDILGRPFIGPAGDLLDRIITESVSSEMRYALTNIIACIPIGEDGEKVSQPTKNSIKACEPRLNEFVRICKPRYIVLVGKVAKKEVFGQAQFYEPSHKFWLREDQFLRFCEIPHPAFILGANLSQQGLLEQRAVVTIQSMLEE